ncbi:TPA: hypothetical protein ACH3X2_002224 [Trebouxia sp. C0005]
MEDYSKVTFRLAFLGGLVQADGANELKTPKSKDKDQYIFSCAVDLPDSLLEHQTKGSFVKTFGDGKTKAAQLASLGLEGLRRGQVLDGTGLYAPGFPLVVVQLPFKLNPKTGNLTGEEVYTGWAPSEDWFWSDPEEYFKTFTLQASKLHFDLGDFKVKVEENHDDDVDPMSTQIETSAAAAKTAPATKKSPAKSAAATPASALPTEAEAASGASDVAAAVAAPSGKRKDRAAWVRMQDDDLKGKRARLPVDDHVVNSASPATPAFSDSQLEQAGQQQQLARVKTNRAHKTRTKPPVVAYRTPTQGSEARGVLLEDDCFRPRHQAHTGRLSQKPAEPVLPTEAPVPSGGTFDSKEALRNVAPDAWSKDKAYWNQKIKTEYGVMFPRIDISHLEISEKFPKRLNGEVKINPFNLEKAEVIRDTFDLGKLDWALVIITTEPECAEVEDEAMSKIKGLLVPARSVTD